MVAKIAQRKKKRISGLRKPLNSPQRTKEEIKDLVVSVSSIYEVNADELSLSA